MKTLLFPVILFITLLALNESDQTTYSNREPAPPPAKPSRIIGTAKEMRPETRTPEPHTVDTIGYDSNHKAIIYRNNQVETVTIKKYHPPTLHS